MKKPLLPVFLILAQIATTAGSFAAGFGATAQQFNIPASFDDYDYRVFHPYSEHTLIDMDGDGRIDMLDTENESTTSVSEVFYTSGQKHWKVYLGTPTGFSSNATQWNIPASFETIDYRANSTYGTYVLMDMNGDNKPDLVDAENESTTSVDDVFYTSGQKHWKVYINNGSGFNLSATQWNIPAGFTTLDYRCYETYGEFAIMDMDGDKKPDLVDAENESTTSVDDVFYTSGQKHWKVYLNNGSGFNLSATQWNIPAGFNPLDYRVTNMYSEFVVMDITGDGKPDLVDSENEGTTSVDDVFYTSGQKHWKVYVNSGAGFSTSATQWNIPSGFDALDYRVFETYSEHVVVDMNGDGLADLVDTENQSTTSSSDPFSAGTQKYWRVYLNTSSGFSMTPTQWNIPNAFDTYNYRFNSPYSQFVVMDMDGDRTVELLDSENESTTSVDDVFWTSGQRHWKVYQNSFTGLDEATVSSASSLRLFPNPAVSCMNLVVAPAALGKTYEVCDVMGRSISRDILSNQLTAVAIDDLADGLYFLRVEGEAAAVRFVKASR